MSNTVKSLLFALVTAALCSFLLTTASAGLKRFQQENVEVAQRVYDSYRRKFEQGMATSLDLTQANDNYLNAENNYLTAILEVMNAKLQLDKLMNTL